MNTVNSRIGSVSRDRTSDNGRIKAPSGRRDDNRNPNHSNPNEVLHSASLTSQTRAVNNGNLKDTLRTHRGPINLNSITMRNPKIVFDELIQILDLFGVNYRREETYMVACEFRRLKFMIELHLVEKFTNMYVLKFYRKGNESERYIELCAKIFSKLNL